MINVDPITENIPALAGFISGKLDDLNRLRHLLDATDIAAKHEIDLTMLRTIDAGNQAREKLASLQDSLDAFVEMLGQVQEDFSIATAE